MYRWSMVGQQKQGYLAALQSAMTAKCNTLDCSAGLLLLIEAVPCALGINACKGPALGAKGANGKIQSNTQGKAEKRPDCNGSIRGPYGVHGSFLQPALSSRSARPENKSSNRWTAGRCERCCQVARAFGLCHTVSTPSRRGLGSLSRL